MQRRARRGRGRARERGHWWPRSRSPRWCPRSRRLRRRRRGERERRPADGRDHRRADHEHRRQHRRRPAPTITGIVPEGTNSHTFEPKPSVAELLSTADVVYVNGLKLEEPTKELAEANLKDGAEIVELGTRSIPRERVHLRLLVPEGGRQAQPAPLDRPDARACATPRSSATTSSKRDPDERRRTTRPTTTAFAALVDELRRGDAHVVRHDPARQAQAADLPRRLRLLRRDYGWDVIGAIQVVGLRGPDAEGGRRPDRPGQGGEGAGDLRLRGVPEPGARADRQGGRRRRYVDVLRDDDLPGEPGDPEHSWLGPDALRLRHDDRGARRRRHRARRPSSSRDVAPDDAEYPQ